MKWKWNYVCTTKHIESKSKSGSETKSYPTTCQRGTGSHCCSSIPSWWPKQTATPHSAPVYWPLDSTAELPDTRTHLWHTAQTDPVVQHNKREFWCLVCLSVSSRSVSHQLMIPLIAKATRVSLCSLVMMGQRTWTVFSLLWEPDNKLSNERILNIQEWEM